MLPSGVVWPLLSMLVGPSMEDFVDGGLNGVEAASAILVVSLVEETLVAIDAPGLTCGISDSETDGILLIWRTFVLVRAYINVS